MISSKDDRTLCFRRVYVFLILLISANSNKNWDQGITQFKGLLDNYSGNITYIIKIRELNLKSFMLSQGRRSFV